MGTTLLARRGPIGVVDRPVAAAEDADRVLVERARRDRAAFAPLYDRYFDPVYRYCHRRLGHPEDAADATSLVFARALAALPRYQQREEHSFRSWIFAIAHNVVTDGYRARGRRAEAPIEAAGHLPDGSRGAAPEEAAMAAEARSILLAALDQLSVDQRRIVELRLAGLTGPEIAGVLGRSVGAVKIAQHRAYGKLRVILGEGLSSETPGGARRPGGAA